jgi:hypothetical protein
LSPLPLPGARRRLVLPPRSADGIFLSAWERPSRGFNWEARRSELSGRDQLALVPNGQPEAFPLMRQTSGRTRAKLDEMLRGLQRVRRPTGDLLIDFLNTALSPSLEGIRALASQYGWLGDAKRNGNRWAEVGLSSDYYVSVVNKRGAVYSSEIDSEDADTNFVHRAWADFETDQRWLAERDAEDLEVWWEQLKELRHVWETWRHVYVLEHRRSFLESQAVDARDRLLERFSFMRSGCWSYHVRVPIPEDLRGLVEIAWVMWNKDSCPLCSEDPATHTHVTDSLEVIEQVRPTVEPSEIYADLVPFSPEHWWWPLLVSNAQRYVQAKIHERLRGGTDLIVEGGITRVWPVTLSAAVWLRFREQVSGTPLRVSTCQVCGQSFSGPGQKKHCSSACRQKHYRSQKFK